MRLEMRRLRVHLSDLIPGEPGSSANIDISGITSDSRNVEPGYLFFAIAGNHADGRDYIASAIAAGATAIVTDERELSPSLIADINKNSAVINKNSAEEAWFLRMGRKFLFCTGLIRAVSLPLPLPVSGRASRA